MPIFLEFRAGNTLNSLHLNISAKSGRVYSERVVKNVLTLFRFDVPFNRDVDRAILDTRYSLPWEQKTYSKKRGPNSTKYVGWPKVLEYCQQTAKIDLPVIDLPALDWNSGKDFRCHLHPCTSTKLRTVSLFCRHFAVDHPSLSDDEKMDIIWNRLLG
jgi:hypothetical protein